MNPYDREQIENWATDFLASARFTQVKGVVREYAAQVLVAFLSRACESRGAMPGEVEEPDVKAGLPELREDPDAKTIRMEHLLEAVKETKPSVTEEMEREYEKVALKIKQDAARIGFGPARRP